MLLDLPFLKKSQVHIHIPEGATPKDGPSAGITMVTSLLSLLTETPVLDDLGMTGELTLTGRVLPIGGVKEKLVAARRSGVKVLIFPKDNVRDYDELPEHLKKGLAMHFVEHYDQVFEIAFPSLKPNLPPMNGSDSNSFPLEARKNKGAIFSNIAPLFSEPRVRASREKIISNMTAFIGGKLGLKERI